MTVDKVSKNKTDAKIVSIIGGLVVILFGFGLYKAVVLNKPKETPQQITQKFVDFLQKDKLTDTDKSQITSYYTQNAKDQISKLTSDKESSNTDSTTKPVITVKSVTVDDKAKTATSTIEMSAWIINVPIQFKFVQEGNFLSGYKWKINEVIGIPGSTNTSSKLESTVKANEKVGIGEDWSIIVSSPLNYISPSEWEQPSKGNRLVAVELQYFNDSKSSDIANPSNLTLRDSEGHSYEMTFTASKKPDFTGNDTVTAGGSLRGWVTYEIPNDKEITKAVYSNSYSTVTINY